MDFIIIIIIIKDKIVIIINRYRKVFERNLKYIYNKGVKSVRNRGSIFNLLS